MKQVLVNTSDNWIPSHMQNFIKVGHTVIVVDGSYMTSKRKEEDVSGSMFVEKGLFRLLKVTRINIPFRTSNQNIDSLVYHNNCEIIDALGNIYYCSIINIRAFSIFPS